MIAGNTIAVKLVSNEPLHDLTSISADLLITMLPSPMPEIVEYVELHFNRRRFVNWHVMRFICDAESKIARHGTYNPHRSLTRIITVANKTLVAANFDLFSGADATRTAPFSRL